MNLKNKILELVTKEEKIKTSRVVDFFDGRYSRGYISKIINDLVKDGKLLKGGSTAAAFYVSPERRDLVEAKTAYRKKMPRKGLEEHLVLDEIDNTELYLSLKDNVRSIFNYSFSEMLNNAIDHSFSDDVIVEVKKTGEYLEFIIEDHGVGVFKNIQNKKKLASEVEAIQDLLKGKTTTQPLAHSGQGIFFTSKISNKFILESFDLRLIIDNELEDIFLGENEMSNKGTRVIFFIALKTKKHLVDIFRKYQSSEDAMDFDKTEVKIKLYTMGTVHVSRSQARRVLAELEKFKYVVLDFDKVPTIGQGFADEIFRVYKIKHPEVDIKAINMNDAVKFMIGRVDNL
jgi:phage pi2 protein 07